MNMIAGSMLAALVLWTASRDQGETYTDRARPLGSDTLTISELRLIPPENEPQLPRPTLRHGVSHRIGVPFEVVLTLDKPATEDFRVRVDLRQRLRFWRDRHLSSLDVDVFRGTSHGSAVLWLGCDEHGGDGHAVITADLAGGNERPETAVIGRELHDWELAWKALPAVQVVRCVRERDHPSTTPP
jgi:hypothetical protein